VKFIEEYSKEVINMTRNNILKFIKMQSCGNDYVYVDMKANPWLNIDVIEQSKLESIIIRLSNRHYGIGSDGVIFVCESKIADAKMRMFNADGSEGKMCGNGIRCVAKLVGDMWGASSPIKVETLSGIKVITVNGNEVVVDMGKAELVPKKIPVIADEKSVVNKTLVVDDNNYNITCVGMGNPHCVVFVDDVEGFDVEKNGTKFEKHEIFPERVNTEFIEIIDSKTLRMRVWERGSGETMACGTGACAAVVATTLNNKCKKGDDIKVILNGGELVIKYTDETVLMTGDANVVFEGQISIET